MIRGNLANLSALAPKTRPLISGVPAIISRGPNTGKNLNSSSDLLQYRVELDVTSVLLSGRHPAYVNFQHE